MMDEKIQKTILKIKENDYLRYISGFYQDRIFYLRIETQERESVEVGNRKFYANPNTKEFRLDIRKN